MQIKSGSPSWGKLQKADVGAETVANVTIPAGGISVIVAPEVTVAANDIVFASMAVTATKGGVAGNTVLVVNKSAGTASVTYSFDHPQANHVYLAQPAATSWDLFATHIFRVTAGGTLSLQVEGSSAGSDSTVLAGNADLRVVVIRGS